MQKKLKGTLDRPRLYIFKSNKHIYAQIINDNNSKVLTTKSSISPDIRNYIKSSSTKEISELIGTSIAKVCIQQNIKKVVFDRGKKKYHGKIKALADAIRKEGINF
uniref:Large ribosomal subunit protein uL18c n=1 Tax=Dichotomaria marginata TaxID=268567 RepID=A0A1G4NSI2_9FLOR|nr:Ribosomal protein L18 [Dichotomaria marginata]SCW21607.1 Ribosomal protein L18 [Dichotomaria marginata]